MISESGNLALSLPLLTSVFLALILFIFQMRGLGQMIFRVPAMFLNSKIVLMPKGRMLVCFHSSSNKQSLLRGERYATQSDRV